MPRVCDIRELPSMAALRTWAAAHDATITYAGPDVFARPVYVAQAHGMERVARGSGRDPHLMPLVWRSPLGRDT